MATESRAGRPKVSSRETLAEAACELFLEQGYDATSVADITQRAGVSRSSFFNYFSSKSDVLWSGLDARIKTALAALDALGADADGRAVEAILAAMVHDFAPDPLALALRNTTAMGVEDELLRDSALRQARLAAGIATAARRAGVAESRADIVAAAFAAALLAALRLWAVHGAGQGTPEQQFEEVVAVVHDLRWDR